MINGDDMLTFASIIVLFTLLCKVSLLSVYGKEMKNEIRRLKVIVIKKNILLVGLLKQMTCKQVENVQFICVKCNGSGKIKNKNCVDCNGIGIVPEIVDEVSKLIKKEF